MSRLRLDILSKMHAGNYEQRWSEKRSRPTIWVLLDPIPLRVKGRVERGLNAQTMP